MTTFTDPLTRESGALNIGNKGRCSCGAYWRAGMVHTRERQCWWPMHLLPLRQAKAAPEGLRP
jgi:hypothetical protein